MDDIKNLEEYIEDLEKKNAELEAEVEKLKFILKVKNNRIEKLEKKLERMWT